MKLQYTYLMPTSQKPDIAKDDVVEAEEEAAVVCWCVCMSPPEVCRSNPVYLIVTASNMVR
jgi:hypothetical protein